MNKFVVMKQTDSSQNTKAGSFYQLSLMNKEFQEGLLAKIYQVMRLKYLKRMPLLWQQVDLELFLESLQTLLLILVQLHLLFIFKELIMQTENLSKFTRLPYLEMTSFVS